MKRLTPEVLANIKALPEAEQGLVMEAAATLRPLIAQCGEHGKMAAVLIAAELIDEMDLRALN